MDRLRSAPSYLPVRTFLVCAALALGLLQWSSATLGDSFELLIGVLPVGMNAESLVMVLVQRALPTFLLITLALTMGLSSALALAVIISGAGGRISRAVGWLGRAMVGVPPMLWAFGLVYLLVSVWRLPVETLFPYDPPAGMEPATVRLGRALWAWIVPALVLAAPVFGMALFSFTHRLSVLLKDPILGPLKSRGLSRATIKYRHLMPELRVHLARLARPAAALLLALAIPVEHIFMVEGWGAFAADALKLQHPLQLAATVYLAGIMLAAWYVLLDLGDKRSLPPAMEHVEDVEQTQNRVCAVAGGVLAVALLTALWWAPAGSAWQAAWQLTWREAGGSLLISLLATLLVVVSGLAISPARWPHLFPKIGLAATLAALPLMLLWMAFSSLPGVLDVTIWALLVVATAIPGMAAFHATYQENNSHRLAETSFSLGRGHWGYWWDHLFLNALPSLLNWLLRTASTVLIWKGVFDFLCASRPDAAGDTPTWGRMMAQNAARFLDEPSEIAAPALLMALWALSFRLLSRAFRTDTPVARISPFAS